MNAEVKKAWLEALRSSNYVQGHGALRTDNQFCCLGVLCDLIDKTKWELPVTNKARAYSNNLIYPPNDILEKAELIKEECVLLGSYNDEGMSFKQIADRIEERY
jgi:hypothetical protein